MLRIPIHSSHYVGTKVRLQFEVRRGATVLQADETRNEDPGSVHGSHKYIVECCHGERRLQVADHILSCITKEGPDIQEACKIEKSPLR